MKTHLLLFAVLMFASPVMYAQNTIEAYNTGVLAGRSSTPMIADGIGEDARFESITAIWGDGSNLYVADSIAVRRIELNTARVTTLSRTAGSGINRIGGNSGFSYNYRGLYGLWGDGVSLYGADVGAGSVRKIDLTTGGVQTIAQGLGLAWGLSGRGTILYVAAAQAGRVMQVNAATGGASELAVTGSGTPRQCFLGSGCIGYFVPGPRSAWNDGQYLYLTGYSGTESCALQRAIDCPEIHICCYRLADSTPLPLSHWDRYWRDFRSRSRRRRPGYWLANIFCGSWRNLGQQR